MGKKKSKRTPQRHNSATSSVLSPRDVEQDEIRQELMRNEQAAAELEASGGRRSLSVLDMSFDEFQQEVEIPMNDKNHQELNAPKHAYQTVYMSHENVTSPDPANYQPVFHGSTASIGSRKSGHNMVNIPTARSRSRLNSVSSNYNNRADGGAYQEFHSSRRSLNRGMMGNEQMAGGDAANSSAYDRDHSRSFLSDAAEERSLAGFPRSSFGGSRSSVHASQHDRAQGYEDNQVRIRREGPGELERLNYSRRSRSNSGASGAFDGNEIEYRESPPRSRMGRSRTVSESSKKNGHFSRDVPTHSNSLQIQDPNLSETGVRTYHADSEYLQNRLSKLSIHTNNDEFVLVGGHPPNYSSFSEDYSGRSNIPAVRVNDQTFQSDFSSRHDNDRSGFSQPKSSCSNYGASGNDSKTQSLSRTSLTATSNNRGYENRSKSVCRSDTSFPDTMPKYSSSRSVDIEDELGKSISQRSIPSTHQSVSRASSKHTVATTSNTDDRLLLAARYSQSPEAEGLLPVPAARSRNASRNDLSNVATLVDRSYRRPSSVASNASDRVHFAEIPTLFSHPDDHFGKKDGELGEPFRPTSQHQHTPSNISKSKTSLRNKQQEEPSSSVESSLRNEQPPKPLIVTSALTPVAARRVSSTSLLDVPSVVNTPQTVQRVQEPKCIRQIVQPLTEKKTSEIAIQTGDTIRLRQQKWNVDVLSELAFTGTNDNISVPSTPNEKLTPSRPKMNNSFERNGHPAASALNNLFQSRIDRNPSSSNSDGDVRTSRSNSSHQVTMVQTSNSQTSPSAAFHSRLRNISSRYQNDDDDRTDENGNVTDTDGLVEIKPLSTSVSSKPELQVQKTRRHGISSEVDIPLNEPYQTTGSEKSIPTITLPDLNDERKSVADAKWTEGKRTNGDTIRNHIPRGRIRDLATAFEQMKTNAPNEVRTPNLPKTPVFPTVSHPVTQINDGKTRKEERRVPVETRLPGSHTSSNRLGSSMSSNPFLSTSTIQSQGDSRHRSTSSSSQQPNVFTRNTFLQTSKTTPSFKTAEKPFIPSTVNYLQKPNVGISHGDGGFVSMFESVRKTADNEQKRGFSVSPKTQKQNDGLRSRQMKPSQEKQLGAGDRSPTSSEDNLSHRRSHSYAPLTRGDHLRSSYMPKKESRISGNTPVLRRQTAVIERTDPYCMNMPKTLSVNDFRFGSNVEILRNEPRMVPIQKTLRRSGEIPGSYIDIPTNKPHHLHNYDVPVDHIEKQDALLKSKNVPVRVGRAKTQEVPSSFYHQQKYESRAVSGEIGEEKLPEKSFFTTGRDAFGRQTTENLYESQKNVDVMIPPSWDPNRNQWKTTTTTTTYTNQKVLRKPERNMFEEKRKLREQKELEEKSMHYSTFYPHPRPLEISPKVGRNEESENRHNLYEKHPSKLNLPTNFSRNASSTVSHHHYNRYSPPTTEDAGSRITHHASTIMQDDAASYDNRLTNEDSSIRGKIDRLFEFVENDDSSRKTLRESSTLESNDTLGRISCGRFEKKSAEKSPAIKYSGYIPVRRQRAIDQQGEWERVLYNDEPTNEGGVSTTATFDVKIGGVKDDMNLLDSSMSPRRKMIERQLQSPERRNTVAGNDVNGEEYDNGFEYSLSQYREMQREQFRRRLGSTEDPQFFRSPSLIPHAGQSLQAYRTRDLLGTPSSGEKFHLDRTNSNIRSPPTALATSTPIESPQSLASFSSRNRQYDVNRNVNSLLQNDTFVSSISGISTVDKQADNMRKINKLSYMIEITQKQMTMNEAALSDAIKKGKQYNEIAANRSILITRETLRLQRAELRRLHAMSAVRHPPPPVARELRGNVIFSNISVQLNKNFCSRLTPADSNTYAFVALFKCGHQVEATEFIPLRVENDMEVLDRIVFEQQIQFSDVPIDFSVHLDFYAMRVSVPKTTEHSLGSSFAAKCKNLIGPPHKKPPTTTASETAFKVRGRIVLDRDASGERCFYLDDVTYPLEGTVLINTTCSRLPDAFEVDFRGFLTMFLTISNMASWERYWAVLRRGVVYFWKYPDEEQLGKEPRMQIDLTKCTNNSIDQCIFDVCPRPNSFAVEILVEVEEATVGRIVEKKRVLLSADTAEMLNQWLFALNQTLDVIRGPI